MRKYISTIAFVMLFLYPNLVWAHDLKMAFFELSSSASGVNLMVTFDKDDLALALTKINPDLEGETDLAVWEAEAKKYLGLHFKLQLDDHETSIVPGDFSYEEDYVRLSIPVDYQQPVKSVNIWSDCLIDDIRGQSNIVKSKLNGKTRTFRLNKKRTAINISY